MSSPDLASRIAARNKARVDRLTLDIVERGIDAAIEFALEVIEGKGKTGLAFRKSAALAMAEISPDDPVLWSNHDINLLLREHCALAIKKGEDLSPALRTLAATALRRSIPAKPRGQPSNLWLRMLVCSVLRDLKLAGIPVYEGDGSNGKAEFTGVEVITKVLEIEETTLHKWLQKRDKKVWDI